MRNGDSIAWFESRTHTLLEALPNRDRFQGLSTGDLFICWSDQECACRVWRAKVVRRTEDPIWDVIGWGELDTSTQRYFVVTASGLPSWVEKSTWDKAYRRPETCLIHTGDLGGPSGP